jgi:DNA-binding Xre family transcriptional regulator
MKELQIGACVRMAMAKNQMSKRELAIKLGKTRQTTHSYSQGKCKNIETLADIAEACGLTYEKMMKLAD